VYIDTRYSDHLLPTGCPVRKSIAVVVDDYDASRSKQRHRDRGRLRLKTGIRGVCGRTRTVTGAEHYRAKKDAINHFGLTSSILTCTVLKGHWRCLF